MSTSSALVALRYLCVSTVLADRSLVMRTWCRGGAGVSKGSVQSGVVRW
ncbi:hypothetical protein E2C01_087539 [Portunus trituberculatus]|uniref:Uncharacterized protein n=1 Tax=Portunus trituberculatus TaxID=210409 RepID=A0A5B7J3M3_PORTR|nr:hypothetical protein [Portunus trituberculatus]